MNCILCDELERSWNPCRRRVEVTRVGENVRSIVCSRCIQAILAAGPDAARLKHRVVEKGTPLQQEAVEKFFGKVNAEVKS